MTKTVAKTVVGAVEHGRRKSIGAKGRALIERLAAEGHTNVSIARALRMSGETLRLIRKRDPRVQEALDRGRATLEVELTHLLLEQARNGHVVAMIYLTKSRCGWAEGQPPADTRPNVTINLPGSFSPAEYLERLRTGSGAPGGREVGTLPSPDTEEKDDG